MSTTLDRIVALVQDEIKRPDKAAEVNRRIQNVTLNYHRLDLFARDLQEVVHIFMVVGTPTAANIQQIDRKEYPLLRRIRYIRGWNPVQWNSNSITNAVGSFEGNDFEQATPGVGTMDGYGYDRDKIWYLAGNQINMRSVVAFDRVALGYYADPLVNPVEQLDSWIANEYSSMVALKVASQLYISLGKVEEANRLIKVDLGGPTGLEMAFLGNQVLSK